MNPNPDLGERGMARQAAAAGWSYVDLIARIVDDARARTRRGSDTEPDSSGARPHARRPMEGMPYTQRLALAQAGASHKGRGRRDALARGLHESVTTVDELVKRFGIEHVDQEAVQRAIDRFNLRITPEVLKARPEAGRPVLAPVRPDTRGE